MMGQIICFDMGQFYVKPYSGENTVTVQASDQLAQMTSLCRRIAPTLANGTRMAAQTNGDGELLLTWLGTDDTGHAWTFGPDDIKAIRAALGCNLSEEQVECARLEAELEKAREDGVIMSYGYDHDRIGAHVWFVRTPDDRVRKFAYNSKVCGCRDAAGYANTLRKPALPEPGEMDTHDVAAEMRELGYECFVETSGYPSLGWRHQRGDSSYTQSGGQSAPDFHREALRAARELARERA